MHNVTIIGGFGTDNVLTRMEGLAKAGGYQIEEWLTPGHNGVGLRVAATMRIKGAKHGLAFKWDGDDINALVERCIALDYSMNKLPQAVAQGKVAPWETH